MSIFGQWCDHKKEDVKKTSFWIVSEKQDARASIIEQLLKIVRSHYDDLNRIADDLADLGYKKAEKILKARMPQTKRARSGDLGEILATEFAEEYLSFKIPIKRLRYKDGRDLALRGDDFIGFKYSQKHGLQLLKGEAKSRLSISRTTINEARQVLNRDHGRCTPISLAFVSDRLLDSANEEDKKIGKILRSELATDSLSASQITHALVTVSGNAPLDILRDDLKAADTSRTQNVVSFYIPDHGDFIKLTFEQAQSLGKP